MKENKHKTSSRGQMLFEVVFAVGIAALVLVAVVSLSTTSLRNSNFSTDNALATKYSQDALEWLRSERDTNWQIFYDRATVAGSTICLGSLTWSGGCPISGTSLSRQVTLTQNGSDRVDATVVVSWSDGSGTHEVKNVSIFTSWNR